jgi:hypothetical protein
LVDEVFVKLIVSPTHAVNGRALKSAVGAWAIHANTQNKPEIRRIDNLSIV